MADLQAEVRQMVQALGYETIEVHQNNSNKNIRLTLVIYHSSGIGSDDCDKVIRTIMPHAQALVHPYTLQMTVSTPGIDRVFKSWHEYQVFCGKMAKLTLHSGQVVTGVLGPADENTVMIDTQTLSYDQIAKGRLLG